MSEKLFVPAILTNALAASAIISRTLRSGRSDLPAVFSAAVTAAEKHNACH